MEKWTFFKITGVDFFSFLRKKMSKDIIFFNIDSLFRLRVNFSTIIIYLTKFFKIFDGRFFGSFFFFQVQSVFG